MKCSVENCEQCLKVCNRRKLGVVEFGQLLIETGDLDPLYIALWGAKMPRKQLCRWLVCYFCYYHAGLCCWASERGGWEVLDEIARGGTAYPRGSERRHFRAQTAITAVAKLREQFGDAEEMLNWISDAGPRANKVMQRIRTLYGFGEWIAGKIPDVLDRLNLAKIEFVERDVDLMFDSPKKGALDVARRYAQGDDPLLFAHRYLMNNLGHLKAAPRYERTINVQETETIFCKWKSHLSGHYPPGKDSYEIRHGLLRYAKCKTAQRMLKALPRFQKESPAVEAGH